MRLSILSSAFSFLLETDVFGASELIPILLRTVSNPSKLPIKSNSCSNISSFCNKKLKSSPLPTSFATSSETRTNRLYETLMSRSTPSSFQIRLTISYSQFFSLSLRNIFFSSLHLFSSYVCLFILIVTILFVSLFPLSFQATVLFRRSNFLTLVFYLHDLFRYPPPRPLFLLFLVHYLFHHNSFYPSFSYCRFPKPSQRCFVITKSFLSIRLFSFSSNSISYRCFSSLHIGVEGV